MEMEIMSLNFLTALGSIVLLDLLLGGDNAVVIAMAANKLPHESRKKAILIGTAGAVVVRVIMTLMVVWLLTIPYLQVIGGLILLPIALKLLLPEKKSEEVKAADNLMGAVKTIIVADAAMGIDNVLAIAGAAHGHYLLVIIGFLISIPIIVGGSTIIGKVMDKYPALLYGGSALLAWTGASMIVHDRSLGPVITANAGDFGALAIQIILTIGVVAIGYFLAKKECAKANV